MQETIVALATPSGNASISVLRISGENSLDIAKSISKRKNFKPRYAHFSNIYKKNNEFIDEAIIIYFKAPHSFTGEDIVEIQCHGGQIIAELILKECLDLGARLAKAGEFSKRAFLNDKMDLTKAEAIAGLINAKSEDAFKVLSRQLKGEVKNFVEKIREDLLRAIAYSEVNIDYAEEDLPRDILDKLNNNLKELLATLEDTLIYSKSRTFLIKGFKISIIGKANVGKSSLLNKLLSFNRAIVSEEKGTTRDTIEEDLRIASHLVKIVDTAGIRKSENEIEKIGIKRTLASIEESDIILALFDGSNDLDEEDINIINIIKNCDKESLILINKSDLELKIDKEKLKEFKPKFISCLDNKTDIIKYLKEILDKNNKTDNLVLSSLRQIRAVEECKKELELSLAPLKNSELELFSFHLNLAIKAISSISKPYEFSELLDKIFGEFCLGK